MAEVNELVNAVIAGLEATCLEKRDVLRSLFNRRIIQSQNLRIIHWDLMDRAIEVWYNFDWQMLVLVDDLKTIVEEKEGYFYSDILRLQSVQSMIQNILKHLTEFIGKHEVTWEETSLRVNWIFKLAMNHKEHVRRCQLLAMACGEHLPLLTCEEEKQFLPESKIFREWYALGVLLQKGNAFASLRGIRHTESIGAGKAEKQSPHTVEDIGDTIISLMKLPSSNGCANDQIISLMGRVGGMPGGGEELKRIESEAPSHRKGEFVE